VADMLIGPRTGKQRRPFKTQHGDSGTLWLLDPQEEAEPKGPKDPKDDLATYRPVAVQWGGNVFTDSSGRFRQPFALATLLSTACHPQGQIAPAP